MTEETNSADTRPLLIEDIGTLVVVPPGPLAGEKMRAVGDYRRRGGADRGRAHHAVWAAG